MTWLGAGNDEVEDAWWRSVSLTVKGWFELGGSIRLAVPDFPLAFVRIKEDPERPSGHPKLFRFLARYLRTQGVPEPRA